MKMFIYNFFIIVVLLLPGCDNSNKIDSVSNKNDTVNFNTKTSNVILNKQTISSNTQTIADDKMLLVDKAQKDYQDAYNNYVKCLREHGPQRIETLQALTIYQKNYHIYQNLLNTISENNK